MGDSENRYHPVWDVYDSLRTARLNVKYLQIKLTSLQRKNFVFEWIIAISTFSSVTALSFLRTEDLQIVWQVFGAIAVLLAIAKPLISLSTKIQQQQERLLGYKNICHELEKITILIKQRQCFSKILREKFMEVIDKKGIVEGKYVHGKPDKKLLMKLEEEVNTELPLSNFYIPNDK